MTPRLSRGAVAELERRVDELFNRLLARLLGGHFSGKSLFFTTDPVMSLPGLFRAGAEEEGGTVDLGLLQSLADVAKHLVDKQRADTKATVVRRINMLLEDVKAGRIKPQDFRNHIEGEMTDLWDRISSNVERVVNTETQHALTMGLREGIAQMNAVRGISDPVVVFIPKNDDALCDECRRVHYIDGGPTPRCWYHSEVSADYHVRGEDRPSFHRMHPHCRCSLATILPGFGFTADGRVTFIKHGWDELKYQRAVGGPLGGVDERRAWGEDLKRSGVEVGVPLKKMAKLNHMADPAFREWFAGSKVADQTGNPLVVYHGTRARAMFDTPTTPAHFGTLIPANEMAMNGIGRSPARIYPVHLAIKNPKRVPDQMNVKAGDWVDAIEQAKAEGHDGLVYTNDAEGAGTESWVAFYPHQVRSVFAKPETDVGEDSGSISATVPGPGHVEPLPAKAIC